MLKKINNKQINLYCSYAFVSSFIMSRGVFLLYLASVGLSVFQIAIYQSIYSVSTTILELPTGYIGDKIGKKKSVIIGTILLAIHAYAMFLNRVIIIFWLLSFFEALAYSFISGSDSALLYEILKHYKIENNYIKINNTILFGQSIITGFSLIIGSFLAEISWVYVYIVTAIVFILASVLLIFVKEVNVLSDNTDNSGLYKVLEKNILYPIRSAFFLFIIFFSACDGLFMCFYNFNQIILPKYNMQTKFIGIFFATLYFINSIAYLLVNKLIKTFNRKQILIFSLLLECFLFFILSFSSNLIFVVIVSILICFCPEIIFSISDSIIQQYIASEYRATFLSIVSLIRSMVSSIIYFIMGYLFDLLDFKVVFIVISLILFSSITLGMLTWSLFYRKRILEESD